MPGDVPEYNQTEKKKIEMKCPSIFAEWKFLEQMKHEWELRPKTKGAIKDYGTYKKLHLQRNRYLPTSLNHGKAVKKEPEMPLSMTQK